MSTHRTTVMINEKNYKSLRQLQATYIKDTQESWSFSAILNLIVEKGLK